MDSIQKIIQESKDTNVDGQQKEGIKVSKKHLINTLNYINFQAGTIYVNFKHVKYDRIISLQAKPQPCIEDHLECFWIEPAGLRQKLNSYKYLDFILKDGQKLILVKADAEDISETGICFKLPEICLEFNYRKVKRNSCKGIQVDFIQNGAIFHGFLSDFSAASFCAEITVVPPQSFWLINPENMVDAVLKKGQDVFYSGKCKIIRQTYGQKTRCFVLEPTENQMRRFKPKEFRSPRHKLNPVPNITFKHPIIQKIINLEVEDISCSGLSVEEYQANSVLLTGLVIPELFIEFANGFTIRCKAQVVYRNNYKTDDDRTYVKCGIAFLEMDMQDQSKLASLLHKVTNKKSYSCHKVDLDALWKFFFESGFIYPEKYTHIHKNKLKFKEIYQKLYIQSSNIARHFIYQDKGEIQAHLSMVRFCENTWLIHHHAASRSGCNKAGLVVLNQLGHYINDFHSLYSTHMNYACCYFRPDNKFPHRVFGGVTRYIDNLKGSSIDPFVYFHYEKNLNNMEIKEPWILAKTQPEDFMELEGFYEHKSSGLMLDALDLKPDTIDNNELNEEYHRLGLKRQRHFFSLKKDGIFKAFIVLNLSDIGLNMSDLTNCIQVIVLDPDDLPYDTLCSGLFMLSKYYDQDEIPTLLYPVSYAEGQSIPYDKTYNLWVLNLHYLDPYFKYLEILINRNRHEENKVLSLSQVSSWKNPK
ncbi:MAG: PilZ domain-containing protein [Candidatus Brocadia sp.]|nr:PilZ domain-containing protein [Candidatus Brocadia sp.]